MAIDSKGYDRLSIQAWQQKSFAETHYSSLRSIDKNIQFVRVCKYSSKSPSLRRCPMFFSQLTNWNRWNQLLVSLSILVFLPLQFPQVFQNHALMASGNPEAIASLAVIPVVGYASGMLGNLLLMNFLAGQREFWGVAVQAVGIVTAGIVLVQLYMVGFIPALLFFPFVIFLGVGMGINYLHFLYDHHPSWSERFWPLWRSLLQLIGVALLPAFVVLQLNNALFPELPEWPGALGFAALASGFVVNTIREQAETFPAFFRLQNSWRQKVIDQSLWLDAWLRRGWRGLAGWTANLLFMFNPLSQLINSLIHPESLVALSMPTQLFCVAGNLLMLSRSGTLLIEKKDRIWCFSSLWDITMRTGIFACFVWSGLMSPTVFVLYCVSVLGYMSFIYLMTKQNCPEASVLSTFEFLLLGRSSEQRLISAGDPSGDLSS